MSGLPWLLLILSPLWGWAGPKAWKQWKANR